MAYDLVIRNGTIVDGSGLSSYRADVAISRDRIAAIGRVREKCITELDAEGHVVTPGFIDGHTHMDAQVMWDPLGSSSCWHGVTTVVMGNCGFTLAPARSEQRELVVHNLERAEDIPRAAMAEGIHWSWETFPEFLQTLDRLPKGINYSAYVGHSALRTWAMGERAFEDPASDDDLSMMGRELRAAMKAGAMGLSTSRGSHETSDGRPVASRIASWDEVRRLVGVLGDLGCGVFEIALEPQTRGEDEEERDESLRRQRALAVETGIPCTFGVNPLRADGTDWQSQLDLIDSTVDAGGRMFGQSHSRGISFVLSFGAHLPFDALPEWQEVRQRPQAEQQRLLRNSDVRRRLVLAAHKENYGRSVLLGARRPNFSVLQVMDRPLPPYRTVADVAVERGVDPVDAMIDMALETDFSQLFLQPVSLTDPEILLEIMRHPRTVMTFSDSGAHVTQIMDSSIQTHLLGYWVREQEAFTLEEAVRMLTLAPARAWGFPDRGLVREGMTADLNIFDPATVAPLLPEVVHSLPGGGWRLEQRATGFLATVVAGEILMRGGEHTGGFPGRLLRGPQASS